jgi:hypothetical protein
MKRMKIKKAQANAVECQIRSHGKPRAVIQFCATSELDPLDAVHAYPCVLYANMRPPQVPRIGVTLSSHSITGESLM